MDHPLRRNLEIVNMDPSVDFPLVFGRGGGGAPTGEAAAAWHGSGHLPSVGQALRCCDARVLPERVLGARRLAGAAGSRSLARKVVAARV